MSRSKIIILLKQYFFTLLVSVFFNSNISSSFADQYPSLNRKIIIDANILNPLNGDKNFDKNPRIKIDSYFSINFNENFSTKTSWKLGPIKNRITAINPDRYRSFFDDKKNYSEFDFVIEQLKIDYDSEGLEISFGKMNPKYGALWNSRNKIGYIALDMIRDYELREKIGYQIAFLEEDFSIYIANFFNDNTDLSNSLWGKRGKENKFTINRPGNTSTLSSYCINIESKMINLVDNLTYNLAYSNLAVDGSLNQKDQKSFLLSLEQEILFMPIKISGEFVQINNLLGIRGKKARYLTTSLFYTNNDLNLFLSSVKRRIKLNKIENYKDRANSYGASYLINNKYNIEVSSINLKEDGNRSKILQLGLSLSF